MPDDRGQGRERGKGSRPDRPLKEVFTPLNKPIVEVYHAAMAAGHLTKKPWPMKPDPEGTRRDPKKYCAYHDDHGHWTTECNVLKRDIEAMIQQGHLKQFVDKPRPAKEQRATERTEDKPAEADIEVNMAAHQIPTAGAIRIHTIAGGPGLYGSSANSRKKYAREILSVGAMIRHPKKEPDPITFTADDLKGVDLPHDDALVITTLIGPCLVSRLLIDPGSACDIIFLDALKEMGLAEAPMAECSVPVVGVTGDTTPIIGILTLPVSIGEASRKVTMMRHFVVINVRSAYNGILGRPFIHSIGGYPSTYCQKIKFQTPGGVGEVKGDQRAARATYVVSVKLKEPVPSLGAHLGDMTMEEIVRNQGHGDSLDGRTTKEERRPTVEAERAKGSRPTGSGIFAWPPEGVPGLNSTAIRQGLQIDPKWIGLNPPL